MDQEVCEEEDPASARRGDRSVVHLRRMMRRDDEEVEVMTRPGNDEDPTERSR